MHKLPIPNRIEEIINAFSNRLRNIVRFLRVQDCIKKKSSLKLAFVACVLVAWGLGAGVLFFSSLVFFVVLLKEVRARCPGTRAPTRLVYVYRRTYVT